MAEWEYKVFDQRGGPEEDQTSLDKFGNDDWELVSVIEYDGERRFFLKRPKAPSWAGPK